MKAFKFFIILIIGLTVWLMISDFIPVILSDEIIQNTPDKISVTPIPGHVECSSPFICGNGICERFNGETPENCPGDCGIEPVIGGISQAMDPYQPLPSHGDFWLSTWADDGTPDGKLYMVWGDGCGAGLEWGDENCDEWSWGDNVTDLGIVALTGTLPDLECQMTSIGCLRYTDIPDGISGPPHTGNDNKRRGILAIDKTIYLSFSTPQWEVQKGEIAYSNDEGETWTVSPGTPWIAESKYSPRSYFRCLMFINMGRNYEANTDGYVYGLGMGWGWDWDFIGDGKLYLARAPVYSIGDYSSYHYYAGTKKNNEPIWTSNQNRAVPVPGLYSNTGGSAIYHEGVQRYLFMNMIGLFEAKNPWGPWTMIAPILRWGNDEVWKGAALPALLTKDAEPGSVYFTSSGFTERVGYRLNIGKINFISTADENLDAKDSRRFINPIKSPASISTPSPDLTPEPTPTCTSEIVIAPNGPICIQNAINSVCEGGRVLLKDGTYLGTGNRDIDFHGKNITLESLTGNPEQCTINCNHAGRGFFFHSEETHDSKVKGISIVNGYSSACGGAIACLNASPIIENCVISCSSSFGSGGGVSAYRSDILLQDVTVKNCTAGFFGGGIAQMILGESTLINCKITGNRSLINGGGIRNERSSTQIINCNISDNRAEIGGGLIFSDSCRVQIFNSHIMNNIAKKKGGGLHFDINILGICDQNSMEIINCTFRNNLVEGAENISYGGAICAEQGHNVIIKNCIFFEDQALYGDEIALYGWKEHVEFFGEIPLMYSNVQGGQENVFIRGNWNLVWGDGMIDKDPLFVQGPDGNSYLSQTAAGQSHDSPSVDAGASASSANCFNSWFGDSEVCMDNYSTRIDMVIDNGTVDHGAHYPSRVQMPAINRIGLVTILIVIPLIIVFLMAIRNKKSS